jgi:hypothetical protein
MPLIIFTLPPPIRAVLLIMYTFIQEGQETGCVNKKAREILPGIILLNLFV